MARAFYRQYGILLAKKLWCLPCKCWKVPNLSTHKSHTSTPFWTWIILIIHVSASSSPAEVIKTKVSKHLNT
jgi:hypothetical protein